MNQNEHPELSTSFRNVNSPFFWLYCAVFLLSVFGITSAFAAKNQSPIADAGPDQTIILESGQDTANVVLDGSGSNDPDGDRLRYYDWQGTPDPADRVSPTVQLAEGTYTFSLFVRDQRRWRSNTDTVTVRVRRGQNPPPPPLSNVSINSTSANGTPMSPVPEQPVIQTDGYTVLSINDLGMHCGDLDTRISSILPPFNVLRAQVIQRGVEPEILTPGDNVDVVYTAASNPDDPILEGLNAGGGPVASSRLNDGSVFKTNFWAIANDAYDPFYPPEILPAFYDAIGSNNVGLGLPAPNTERLYLGDGGLEAEQQEMPGRPGPYALNEEQSFHGFFTNQPFFINFPFGYVAEDVNIFEAPGIPITAYDDEGRENPWPLFRVQAKDSGGTTLATNDTVVPISGEANCGACHNDPTDQAPNPDNPFEVAASGSGVDALLREGGEVAFAENDPEFEMTVPLDVSLEYAADLNLVRLHDLKHGTQLEAGGAVVCQTCHYTPALDLAQLGPLGPEFDPDGFANGRDQIKHKSMSNVMHSHHDTVTNAAGEKLFPSMPPPVDENGNLRDADEARLILEATCYQCHPGRRTDCLRGAMSNGGMLCQDCHGDMQQVGDDFTREVSPSNPGAFELAGNFYDPDDPQPRVPWANEPGCGSCHTGDAMDNLHGTPNTVGDPEDGIRLMQAWRVGDEKATPIVPENNRFAENIVPDTFNGMPNNGAGNPMLYRVSKGHEGVFCEGCHGATHGIWPNKNPLANDNVAALQLQGHTGTISECVTCHEASAFEEGGELAETLGGPHGMHPVGQSWFGTGEGHEKLAEENPDECRACHGRNGQGTVLSKTFTERTLTIEECERGTLCPGEEVNNLTVVIPKGTEITCVMCHENELEGGGGQVASNN